MKTIRIQVFTDNFSQLLEGLGFRSSATQGTQKTADYQITLTSIRRNPGMTSEEVLVQFVIGTTSQIVGGVLADYIWEKLSQRGRNTVSIGDQIEHQDLALQAEILRAAIQWED
jgi:hypothetical protein